MRIFGPRTSLSVFRWDLVYLHAQLAADERPGVAGLATPVHDAIAQVGSERSSLEQAEDAATAAYALRDKRDTARDRLLVTLGGVARTTDKHVYAALFPTRSPTKTAQLGIDAESIEIKRILGELGQLSAQNPLRAAYEAPLGAAQQALEAADAQTDQAVVALALQRAQVARFKLKLDELRVATHAQLVVLLKDRGEADGFFRTTTAPPGEEQEEAAPEAPAPSPPAPAPAPPIG